MNFKDGELSEEELKAVKAGMANGNIDNILNNFDKKELEELKNEFDKELSLEELDNIKAGMPQEAVEEITKENEDLFRKNK